MRLCAGGTAAQKVEKQHDQADYQDDVNEAAGYVKSEKPNQPKNDQNCGDYPEHFLSLLASRRERVRELVLANPVRGACGVEELRTVIRIVDVGAADCLVVDTFGFSFLIWGFALRGEFMAKKTAARCCTVLGRGAILWGQVRAIMRWLENCGFA